MTKEDLRDAIIQRVQEHCNPVTKSAMGSPDAVSWLPDGALIWLCDVAAEEIYNRIRNKVNELVDGYNTLLEDYNAGRVPSRAARVERLPI